MHFFCNDFRKRCSRYAFVLNKTLISFYVEYGNKTNPILYVTFKSFAYHKYTICVYHESFGSASCWH